ncbi:MAG: hypothetical protein VCB77_08495 [Alphaproteobacteria bacterium]
MLSSTVRNALADDQPGFHEPRPKTAFGASLHVWADVLSAASVGALDRLVSDIARILRTEDTDGSFYYPSFWCPADDATGNWRNFFAVFSEFIGADSFAGVEWWLRHDPAGESKVFHFDKDEKLMALETRLENPTLATVYYFDSFGGPTLVAAQSATGDGELRPRVSTELAEIPCRTNQLLAFPGGLRHAVLDSNASGSRTTFLMNWWRARPTGMALTPNEIEFPKI